SCADRSRSRILGFSARARLISNGLGFTRWSMAPPVERRRLLVQDQLALTGDLESVERTVMLDADLVLALEQAVGRKRPDGKWRALDPHRNRLVRAADAIAEVVG